jgi:hypothetical protein
VDPAKDISAGWQQARELHRQSGGLQARPRAHAGRVNCSGAGRHQCGMVAMGRVGGPVVLDCHNIACLLQVVAFAPKVIIDCLLQGFCIRKTRQLMRRLRRRTREGQRYGFININNMYNNCL